MYSPQISALGAEVDNMMKRDSVMVSDAPFTAEAYENLFAKYQKVKHDLESASVVSELHNAMHESTRRQLTEATAKLEALEQAQQLREGTTPLQLGVTSDESVKQHTHSKRVVTIVHEELEPQITVVRSTPTASTRTKSRPPEEKPNTAEAKEDNLEALLITIGAFTREAQSLLHVDEESNPPSTSESESNLLAEVQGRFCSILNSMRSVVTTKTRRRRPKPQKENLLVPPDTKQNPPTVISPPVSPGNMSLLPNISPTKDDDASSKGTDSLSVTYASLSSTCARDPNTRLPPLVDEALDAQQDILDVQEVESLRKALAELQTRNTENESRLGELFAAISDHEALARATAHVERSRRRGPPRVNLAEFDDWTAQQSEDVVRGALEKVRARLLKFKLRDVLDKDLRAGIAVAIEGSVECTPTGDDPIEVIRKTRTRALRALISNLAERFCEKEEEKQQIGDVFRTFPKAFVESAASSFNQDMAFELISQLSDWWNRWVQRNIDTRKHLSHAQEEALKRIYNLCDLLESVSATVNVEYSHLQGTATNSAEPGPELRSNESTKVAEHLMERGKLHQQQLLRALEPWRPVPNPEYAFTLRSRTMTPQAVPKSFADRVAAKVRMLTSVDSSLSKALPPSSQTLQSSSVPTPLPRRRRIPTVATNAKRAQWNPRARAHTTLGSVLKDHNAPSL